jgi:hypothetical protein
MKIVSLFLALGSLLTGCSSNQAMAPLSVHELDPQHFRAEVILSHFGDDADSSYLRQIYHQQIGLKFFAERLCARGVDIEGPTATDFDEESYQLNYDITCKSS